jgi:hypothetical protein
MGWTVLSTAATSTLTQNHSQTSMMPRAFRTTTYRCSFQSSEATDSSTEPWEKWVMWDLLQKSTDLGPTGNCRKSFTNNMPSSKLSFYVQKNPTLSLLTTSLAPEAHHALGNKYSSSQQKRQHLSASNAPHLHPQLSFPQSLLAKALLTGLIPLRTYRGRLGLHARTQKATAHATRIASHAERLMTTLTSSAISLASGAPKNIPPSSAKTHT